MAREISRTSWNCDNCHRHDVKPWHNTNIWLNLCPITDTAELIHDAVQPHLSQTQSISVAASVYK